MPKTTKQFLALLRNGNIGIPLVILSILAMVILPLPPAVLDILCYCTAIWAQALPVR